MRIAIVNDLPIAVEAIRRVLSTNPAHSIAWVARDGFEAVERCAMDQPDLVLMDLIMPNLNGVEATRRIMRHSPCAILVVTANLTSNQGRVFEAMGAGALDVVNTPVLESADPSSGAEALLTKIDMIGKLLGLADPGRSRRLPAQTSLSTRPHPDCLIAMGASAGGPSALAAILGRLPADFPAPVVIVQHVDSEFAPGLAAWLDQQTALTVRLARESEIPAPGTVLLAGGERHLVFTGPARLGYVVEPAQCSYRPSVDVFFRSLDQFWEADAIAVLLTGMGRDGAEGLSRLRARGHHTIVQDQATSAVYGMPKAAVELGAADDILPLNLIPARLIKLAARRKSAATKLAVNANG